MKIKKNIFTLVFLFKNLILKIVFYFSCYVSMAFPTKKSTLSRSHTRMTVLEWCERKYYLNYYDFDLKKRDKELWQENIILKKIKSLDMRIGEKSHYLLSDYLHVFKNFYNERKLNPALREEQIQNLKNKMKAEMEEEFNYSKQLDFTDTEKFFQRKIGLTEHYYGENIDDQLPLAIEKVCGNLDRFIQSTWNKKIESYFEDGEKVYIETPRETDFESMRVDLNKIDGFSNISVLAAPDFWVVHSDYDYLILDWKSWKEDILQDGISDQLKLYALKTLLKKNKTSLEGMKFEVYEVYLNSMHAYGGELQQQDIESIIQKIQQDVEKQKNLLVDRDPEKNIPVDPDLFSPSLSDKKCETCTFRAVCKKFFK